MTEMREADTGANCVAGRPTDLSSERARPKTEAKMLTVLSSLSRYDEAVTTAAAARETETLCVRKKASKGDRLGRLCVANEVGLPPLM